MTAVKPVRDAIVGRLGEALARADLELLQSLEIAHRIAEAATKLEMAEQAHRRKYDDADVSAQDVIELLAARPKLYEDVARYVRARESQP